MDGMFNHRHYRQLNECRRRDGKYYIFDHITRDPTDKELKLYDRLIRGLRDLPDEFIVFEFMEGTADGSIPGLVFFQTCAEDDDMLHVEVRIDTGALKILYGTEKSREETVALARELFRTRNVPDVSSWDDLTLRVFGGEEEEGRKNNRIGWDLHQGLTSGVSDPDAAIPYYLKAAASGNTEAMVNLGNIYEEREDYERAYYWYHEAAILGNPNGMYNVANMYHWGRYVRQDYLKARDYFEKLHRMGCQGAAFYLGLYSEYGFAGEKNEAEAVRYYREGLDSGDNYCAVNLGRMYCLGLGVEKDEKRGLEYYRYGYRAGDALACANLGWCYETGQGTRKNRLKALEYYQEGAELGEEHCIEALERLGSEW